MEDLDGLRHCKLVRYEDLCEDPIAVARDLFSHTELDWNVQTEHFVRMSVSRDQRSYYRTFRRWKRSVRRYALSAYPRGVSACSAW